MKFSFACCGAVPRGGQKENVRDKQTVEPGNNANEQMCVGEQEGGAKWVDMGGEKSSDMLGLS